MQQTSPIILGSQSPRRKELLSHLGVSFEVLVIPTDESYPRDIALSDVSSFIAHQKALVFDQKIKDTHTIITADTIVLCENEVLQKPNNKAEALEILSKLSNKWHQVITGVCIIHNNQEYVFKDVTDVHFNTIHPSEMNYYIDTYKPYDKAGSYGIQEWVGAAFIDQIKGSYFNVMGLPTHLVYQKLIDLNIIKLI